MPISNDFSQRLYPKLPDITAHFGTPFHLYDEEGIRETGRQLQQAFSKVEGFREYYAVKALPNPSILRIMADMGRQWALTTTVNFAHKSYCLKPMAV